MSRAMNIDLRELWNTFIRMWHHRRWSILSLSGLIVMLTTLVVFSMTPIYQAKTTLLIEQQTANVVSIEDVYGLAGSSREYLLTQFELLKSRSLAQRVVRELKLNQNSEFYTPPKPSFFASWFASDDAEPSLLLSPEDLKEKQESEQQVFEEVTTAFMERIEIDPSRNTQLVTISVEMEDAILAAKAANALAKGYINGQLEAKLNMTETATEWMNERLDVLKINLAESEQKLQEYREKEGLVDLGGVTTVTGQEVTETNTKILDARKRLSSLDNQNRQIQAMKERTNAWRELMTLPPILGHPLVKDAYTAEAKARSKMEDLSKRYGPKHPKMTAAETELVTAESILKTQVEQVIATIERDYQLAKADLESLTTAWESSKDQIQEIKRKEFRLRELQREVDTNRSLYDVFMKRMKEASATSTLENVNARIVDPATAPKDPAKPRKKLIILLSAILSMMAAIGLAFLLEKLNDTIKAAADVESKIGLPLLGILPLVKSGLNRQEMVKLFRDGADRSFSEALRTIRTAVILSGLDDPHKIILVTSSVPGEGKSSTATNLAFALGAMEKTLLVEADLRRPTMHRNFDVPAGAAGLADIAAGTTTVEDCIVSIGDIDLLPCGTIPPNPLELLSSQRFADVINALAERYQRIVIDTPPMQAVSDALVLAQQASTVLYVVKADATPTPIVRKSLQQFERHDVHVTGIVLNQVDVEKSKKYGYGYYRYGYGGYYDYYGYSSGKKQEGESSSMPEESGASKST
jgi:succinoglycan biosynthesis transport protein ExoP